jgi:hypothetical protein
MGVNRAGVRVLFLLALAALAACTSAPLIKPEAPPPPAPAAQETEAACLAELDERKISYEKVADWHDANGCGITWAVRIKRSAIQWNRPALMACPLAVKIWDFETRVVEPAAKRELRQSVREMWNYGTYSCRGEVGGHPDRLSEHARGRAIDIGGFTLADGTVVTLLRDWTDSGAKGRFLHEVAKGACREFKGVLTPDSNSYHANHLHLDIGAYKFCSL